jgi:hypothetical protein
MGVSVQLLTRCARGLVKPLDGDREAFADLHGDVVAGCTAERSISLAV